VTYTVDEKRPLETKYEISFANEPQWSMLIRENEKNRVVMDALQPIVEKKAAIARIQDGINSRDAQMKAIAADQQRIRENLQALQNTSEQRALGKRFAAQLTEQEDRLALLRREISDLFQTFQQAKAELEQLFANLALDLRLDGQPAS
jgi:chromosome segregation ATPase